MFPGVLIWLAYLALMPLMFIGWAAFEIKLRQKIAVYERRKFQ